MDENDFPQLRKVVPCDRFVGQDVAKTAVLLTFGQSNGGNHGGSRFIGRPGVANFDFRTGKCYHAEDPLIGATGLAGSPWTRLGDKLVGRGINDAVLIVPISIGGTYINQWAPGGQFHGRLLGTLDKLQETGIKPTAFLWHHGEADSRLSYKPGEYSTAFLGIVKAIRDHGLEADIYAAQATVCEQYNDYIEEDDFRNVDIDRQVRVAEAQEAFRREVRALPALGSGIRLGPDTDAINPAGRRDDCHFADSGQDAHAEAWFMALTGKRWRTKVPDTHQLIVVHGAQGKFKFAKSVGRLTYDDCREWVRISLARARQAKYVMYKDVAYSSPRESAILRPMCVKMKDLQRDAVYRNLITQPLPIP